jgi:lipooligosaccharide transport system permease protein
VTGLSGTRHAARIVERNALAFRHTWWIIVTGAVEPLFFLLGARLGIGSLVGGIPVGEGRLVPYATFVAPALLATSAANGVVYDTTFNFFDKLKYQKTYDAMLATPVSVSAISLGELTWAMLRSAVHSVFFVATMAALGLLVSWWAVLAFPAVLVVAWGFAGLGLAATTYVRSWQDFDWHQLAWLPMFLLSASFFPLSVYPEGVRWMVQVTPMYQGVALLRQLTLGTVDASALLHAAYLAAMGWWGLRHAGRRMHRLLLH